MKNIKNTALILSVLIMSFLIGYLAFAWQDPTAPPPGDNVSAPLNVGNIGQSKRAGLILNTDGAVTGLIVQHGNVGIGTTSPTQRLDIDGQIRIRGGSPAEGRVLTAAADGTASWQEVSGTLPLGAQGQTLRYDIGAWQASNLLFHDAGNARIGIGTTSPIQQLSVGGTLHFHSGGVNSNVTNSPVIRGTSNLILNAGEAGDIYFNFDRGQQIRFSANGSERMRIASTGNVGIGTTAPTQRLHVDGNLRVTGSIRTGDTIRITNTGQLTNMMVGVWHTSEDGLPRFHFGNGTHTYIRTGNAIYFRDAGNSTTMTISSAGSVGVGTAGPQAKLEVYTNVQNTGGIRSTDGGGGTVFTVPRLGTGGWNSMSALNDIGIIFHRGAIDTGSLVIGQWSDSSNGIKIAANGNVGIGTGNPEERLHVSGNVRALGYLHGSDMSLKKDILPLESSLDKILQLQGISFIWKENNQPSIGFVAQEVEKVFPEIVFTGEVEGLKSIEYAKLIAPLVEAVKEQQKEIEELKKEIETLKEK